MQLVTQEDVCDFLLGRGCKEFPYPYASPLEQGVRAFSYKRVEGPDCVCNERPPELFIFVYKDLDVARCKVPGTVVFNVTAEACGTWCDLRLYSVPRGETPKMLDIAYAALEAMWKAGFDEICKGRKEAGFQWEE